MRINKNRIIGLVETIVLENNKEFKAKIDTGADSSSIDSNLLKNLSEKKVESYKTVKSALGKSQRPTIRLEFNFHGVSFSERFTISDRSNLRYKILIGKDILRKGNFLINPNK